MSDLAAAFPELPNLLVRTLGAVTLMVFGLLLLLLLLEALYLLALGIYAGRKDLPRGTLKAAALAVVAAISGASLAPLAAQTPRQTPAPQTRTIEPRFTRLFGSDSLEMGQPVMSPDGRWIVFNTYETEVGNLWVVPATGGEPTQLTSGRHSDYNAVWFPAGDRIAFRSDRPSAAGNPLSYVMVLPFDPRTGRASGPARQASLEPATSLAVSPDGESIAYATRRDTVVRLMVIPATGGNARQLAEIVSLRWGISPMRWSADGAYVYFTLRSTGSAARSVMRVPASGGRLEQLGTVQSRLLAISPSGDRVLLSVDRGPGQAPSFEVAAVDGRSIARFTVQRNMQVSGFTPDGRALLAQMSNMVAPIRVVPVAGGPSRQLTDAREYDWPLGWSSDASRVLVGTLTSSNGGAVLEVPVDGGPATQWPIPPEAKNPFTVSSDGRYIAYTVAQSSQTGDTRTLVIRRLQDGWTRVVTRAAVMAPQGPISTTGPGGSYTNGNEFFYFQSPGDRLELWTTPPEGPSRLLRSFPASYAGRTGFGVHGSRIAYTAHRGDSTSVFVAEARNGQPRQIATVAGSANWPVWSHDGHWLALEHYAPGEGSRYGVLLIGVGANGAPTVPPRILEAGPQWGWQIEWLPDDHAFTVFGMTGQANQTHVFLVSLREGERPVALTRDDPSTRWGYELSPDGRYVAYPAEIPRGSSLWRIDLGDLLRPSAARRGR